MRFELTAQPIGEDGAIGFPDDRPPITAEHDHIYDSFAHVAERILLASDEFDAWDLTLQVSRD